MLGARLRQLREEAGLVGWEAAPPAKMDTALLSKIERGIRLPTESQLEALAKLYMEPLAPLAELRLAADMVKRYGNSPNLTGATALVQEGIGEYRVNKRSATADKPPKPVNKRGKSK